MSFTPQELANITNAALDFYFADDGLTEMERAQQRTKDARRDLRYAQRALDKAIAWQKKVRSWPKEDRNRRRSWKGGTSHAEPDAAPDPGRL